MKNLLHNIQILAMLALTMVGIQSCSDDWHDVGDVQVNFTAMLPTDTRTRSFGKAEQVKTLVVGIFKKGVADELVRPLAQINVGTTGTPMQATFKANGVPNIFHPFTNTVSGAAEFTWNFSETTTETFSADGTEYNYLAMGYVFAPTTATKISAELTLKDGNANKTVEFPQVEIEANQRSNIAGNFTLLQEN